MLVFFLGLSIKTLKGVDLTQTQHVVGSTRGPLPAWSPIGLNCGLIFLYLYFRTWQQPRLSRGFESNHFHIQTAAPVEVPPILKNKVYCIYGTFVLEITKHNPIPIIYLY